MASYTYTPLIRSQPDCPSGDTQIRLVELPPGSLESDISCSLSSYKLSLGPQYEALFYCWGQSGDWADITCDGKLLQIQSNVKDFLLRTRVEGTSRTLWIDGSWMNQAD
jgi:hypothetical protein